MYILNMTNKKRSGGYYQKKLGRYKLTRKNILIIEKLLRTYADEYEKRHIIKAGGNPFPPHGRRHMPRKYADMHTTVNGFSKDSIKFIPKSIGRSSHITVQCGHGIKVTFTPFKTEVGAQMNYATGPELMVMKDVTTKIQNYISNLPKAFYNRCDLS